MKQSKGRRKQYEERSKDKYDDAKGEIKKLRKEILQLRKENAKLRGRDADIKEYFDEMSLEIEREIAVETKCPKCGSKDIKIIEKLKNGKDYYFCQNPACGARGPK